MLPRPARRASPITALAVGPARTLRQKDVQLMLVGAAIVNASHAMLFAFSAIYWQGLGLSGTSIGLLWSAGVFAEVVVFVLARQIRRRISLSTLIVAGSGIAVARWIVFPLEMALPATFSCNVPMPSPSSASISACRTASSSGLTRNRRPRPGGYVFYNGIFLALAIFLAGYVFTRYGVHGFYSMLLVAAVGLVFICAARLAAPQTGISPERGSA